MGMRVAKKTQDMGLMVFATVFVCAGLILRDVAGVNINKFLFLIVVAVPIFLLTTKSFLIFSSLLIPLYVGLPGNYISICILLRLLFELFMGKIRYDSLAFLLSIVAAAFLFMQNLFYDYTAIYYMMGSLDFLTLLLLSYAILQYNETENAIIAFLVGVAAMGAIMLINTLQYYDLQELMNSANRLGDTNEIYQNSASGMVVNIDPNFYGMNVIAAVSASISLLFTMKMTQAKKMAIIGLSGAALIFALIGISRAFALILVLWGILLIMTQGKAKSFLTAVIVVIVFVAVCYAFFSTIVEGLWNRFTEADMEGGNGRINLIIKYYEMWIANIGTMLFGIGLYNCHTHSAPLLYLFGVGVVGAVVILGWFLRIIRVSCWRGQRVGLKRWIPFMVTFIMFSTIPAAGAINYTFPLLISILTLALNPAKGSIGHG